MKNVSAQCKEALKAPSRYIKTKIKIYLKSGVLTLDNSDVISFNIEQGIYNESSVFPVYVIAGRLSLTLDNLLGKYSISNVNSPYAGLLTKNIKIEVFTSVEIGEDIFEDILIGTFYTKQWIPNPDNSEVNILAYDKLDMLINSKLPTIPVLYNQSVKQIFTKLFTMWGYTSTQYTIDESLNTVVIPVFYLLSDTLAVLDNLCLTGPCALFCDNAGKIIVKDILSRYTTPIASILEHEQIYTANIPQRNSDLFAGITFKRHNLISSNEDEVLLELDAKIEGNPTTLQALKFSKTPVNIVTNIRTYVDAGIQLSNLFYDAEYCKLTLNSTIVPTNVKLTFIGYVFQDNVIEETIYNDVVRQDIGEIIYEYDSIYLQDLTNIFVKKTSMLNIVSKSDSFITMSYRGLPYLDIMDRVTISSPSTNINTDGFLIKVVYKYDGALSADAVYLNASCIV